MITVNVAHGVGSTGALRETLDVTGGTRQTNALEEIMTTADTETLGSSASGTSASVRSSGAWLAVGSLLLAVGILLHPPPAADPAGFLAIVAGDPLRWTAAHGLTAVGLGLLTVAGLIVLTAGSRLTRNGWRKTAWAVLTVGALWTTTAAVVEATVIVRAATTGDTATFEVWSPFAEAYSAAFLVVLLALATIAGSEARSAHGTTPVWAAVIGAVAGVVGALGMVLTFGAGIEPAAVVWLGSTVVVSLWTVWFGVTLARDGEDAWTARGDSGSGSPGTAH